MSPSNRSTKRSTSAMRMSAAEKDPASHSRPANTGSRLEPGLEERIQGLRCWRIAGITGEYLHVMGQAKDG
jgi:hypothetical protein